MSVSIQLQDLNKAVSFPEQEVLQSLRQRPQAFHPDTAKLQIHLPEVRMEQGCSWAALSCPAAVVCEGKTPTLPPRFVEKYNELQEEGKIEEEKLFEETGKALLASGIVLQRRGVDKVSVEYSLRCLAGGLRKLRVGLNLILSRAVSHLMG